MVQKTFSELLNPALLAELRRIELKSKRAMSADLMGTYRSAFRGSGLVYSDLREYQPGDEIRNIHWKATARTNKVQVKSYEEERQLRVILAVDTSRSTLAGSGKSKHVRAFEFAALLGMMAHQNGDILGLCLFAGEVERFVPPEHSRRQFQKILLELMAPRVLAPQTKINQALEFLAQNERKPDIIFVISDFFCEPFSDSLKRLAARHDVILCLLDDSSDQSFHKAGLVEFEDAETGERRIIDTSRSYATRSLKLYHEKRIADLQALAIRSGADFLEVGTKPLSSLAALMRRRSSIRISPR